ncbi:MAG: hypothetical protein AAFQ07_21320, partial [Chloroflexota bacterium]
PSRHTPFNVKDEIITCQQIDGRVTTGQASASEGVVTQGDLIPILVVVGVVVVLVMLGVLFYVRRDTPTNESDNA